MRKASFYNLPVPRAQDPSIRLFGSFSYGPCEGRLPGPARRLLARLLLASRPLGRGELSETLWPESDAERGRFYLRRALMQLRPLLGDTLELKCDRDGIRLVLDPSQVDALTFDHLLRVRNDEALLRAVELHAAPLLADWPDEWVAPERESRRQEWHRAIESLATTDLREERWAEAARRLTTAVVADPLRESSQRLLIEALRRAGDAGQAERQYERFEREMRTKLGLSPAPETRGTSRTWRPAPLVATSGPERYLPVVLTELVGRDRARAEIVESLGTNRLVTLVGTGGIGKTRLALACAEALAPDATDLVAMIDLASREDDRSLGDLLARSVRAPALAGVEGMDLALRHLEGRRALLLLDNCEHLLDASGELAQAVLARCPGVTILATSRQALGLPDETIFDVPPLDLPASEALFLLHASRKGKPVPPSSETLKSVRRICTALEGLPLALGLAAGALRTTPLSELADDIHGVLGAESGARPRHRSLRATTDWSYRLLTPEEARAMRSVSPLHGFWTLEYAHAAIGSEGGSIESVRSVLRGLVAKCLVGLQEDRQGARFRLLEPIREDAYRRLVEAGEETGVRQRLREAVLAWSRTFSATDRPDAHVILHAEREMDALESVLQDCLRIEEGGTMGLEIVLNTVRLFDYTNRYREGALYLERFLADAHDLDPRLYARGLAAIVHLRTNWGDGPQVLELAERAVESARRTGAPELIAYALSSQGMALYTVGRYLLARAALEEALLHWEEAEALEGLAHNSIWCGKAALALEDLAAAEAHLDRAERLLRQVGGSQGTAVLTLNRARLLYRCGAFAEATDLFIVAERAFSELGDRVHAAAARVGRSVGLVRQGDAVQAAEWLRSAEAEAASRIGDPVALYDGLGPGDFRERLWAEIDSSLSLDG